MAANEECALALWRWWAAACVSADAYSRVVARQYDLRRAQGDLARARKVAAEACSNFEQEREDDR